MVTEMLRSLANRWYVKLGVSALAFLFGGDGATILMFEALAVLMLLDLATGLWRAKREKALSSKTGILSTLTKFAAYAAILVSSRMLELIVTGALGVPVAGVSIKVAIVYLASQEGVSIDENLRAINGVGLAGILNAVRNLAGANSK